jgi:hypothetical protein
VPAKCMAFVVRFRLCTVCMIRVARVTVPLVVLRFCVAALRVNAVDGNRCGLVRCPLISGCHLPRS